MKKIIFALALVMAGTVAYCQTQATPAQKVVKTDKKVDTAQAHLNRALDQQDVVSDAYRQDVKRQIKENNDKIDSLKNKMVKPKTDPANDALKKQVDALEDRNVKLRSKRDE